jgi:ferritin-like protein
MQLEFSTIPPYLCAQWSIDGDPGGAGEMIEGIAVPISRRLGKPYTQEELAKSSEGSDQRRMMRASL